MEEQPELSRQRRFHTLLAIFELPRQTSPVPAENTSSSRRSDGSNSALSLTSFRRPSTRNCSVHVTVSGFKRRNFSL
jgi:hypothetical protein